MDYLIVKVFMLLEHCLRSIPETNEGCGDSYQWPGHPAETWHCTLLSFVLSLPRHHRRTLAWAHLTSPRALPGLFSSLAAPIRGFGLGRLRSRVNWDCAAICAVATTSTITMLSFTHTYAEILCLGFLGKLPPLKNNWAMSYYTITYSSRESPSL